MVGGGITRPFLAEGPRGLGGKCENGVKRFAQLELRALLFMVRRDFNQQLLTGCGCYVTLAAPCRLLCYTGVHAGVHGKALKVHHHCRATSPLLADVAQRPRWGGKGGGAVSVLTRGYTGVPEIMSTGVFSSCPLNMS